MGKMKKCLALLLALALCLSLCACGGEDAQETTQQPAQNNSESASAGITDEVIEAMFTLDAMSGVEHDGLYIKADTATDKQMQYASVLLTDSAHAPAEGFDALYVTGIYYKMVQEDGSEWYHPMLVCLPTGGSLDAINVNSYFSVTCTSGRLGYGTEMTVFRLTDAEKESLEAYYPDMTESQFHLLTHMNEYLDYLGMPIGSEGVRVSYGEDNGAFAECTYELDGRTVTLLIEMGVVGVDAAGQYAISTLVVTGINDEMTEEEQDVLDQFMTFYSLYNWYNEE